MFDVCTTEHIDTIFKFLPHTRVNMGASLFFAAAMIRSFRSARSSENDGTNTLHEMHVAQSPQTYCVIFQHTKRLLPRSSHFSHYIHSHRLAAEF